MANCPAFAGWTGPEKVNKFRLISLIVCRLIFYFARDQAGNTLKIRTMKHPYKSLPSFASLILLAVLLAASGCDKKNAAPTSEASMVDLNRALAVVMMHDGQRLPATNEVADFLKQTGKVFPAAPAGKKIVLDAVTKKFVLEDQ